MIIISQDLRKHFLMVFFNTNQQNVQHKHTKTYIVRQRATQKKQAKT